MSRVMVAKLSSLCVMATIGFVVWPGCAGSGRANLELGPHGLRANVEYGPPQDSLLPPDSQHIGEVPFHGVNVQVYKAPNGDLYFLDPTDGRYHRILNEEALRKILDLLSSPAGSGGPVMDRDSTIHNGCGTPAARAEETLRLFSHTEGDFAFDDEANTAYLAFTMTGSADDVSAALAAAEGMFAVTATWSDNGDGTIDVVLDGTINGVFGGALLVGVRTIEVQDQEHGLVKLTFDQEWTAVQILVDESLYRLWFIAQGE